MDGKSKRKDARMDVTRQMISSSLEMRLPNGTAKNPKKKQNQKYPYGIISA
jgi:hypothetical protein